MKLHYVFNGNKEINCTSYNSYEPQYCDVFGEIDFEYEVDITDDLLMEFYGEIVEESYYENDEYFIDFLTDKFKKQAGKEFDNIYGV